jgi:hypothetical protein
MLKGAIHTHSTYSDGELSLRELRDRFRAAGYAFVCVTDHAEYFDAERARAYAEECDALSDDAFRLIPGLEFGCARRLHVLGIGVTALAATDDPQAVIRHIEREGGISVIAHPKDAAFEWIESFAVLPQGIETWNSKYDGRYAPRPGTFALLRRLQERRPDMRAFYGQDLHWRRQFRGLVTRVRCASPARAEVLAALGRGDFVGLKGELELPSTGALPDELLARFGRVHARSARMRAVITGVNRVARRLGATVPAPIKSQLRRMF